MLPKVANHVLHTTARAVSAQQQALRNVLQSSGSGSSGAVVNWSTVGSSSYGNAGAGAGGAKYHAGSRFYSGYTGAGRAVTQADSSGADSTVDDHDELVAHRAQLRAGSSSSARSRSKSSLRLKDSTPSVLKTVQAHVRAKHSFAPGRSGDVHADEPTLVRQNSSVSVGAEVLSDMLPPPPPPTSSSQEATTSAESKGTTSATAEAQPLGDAPSLLTQGIYAALQRKSPLNFVIRAVEEFKQNCTGATSADWTYVLSALSTIRRPGQTLTAVLETYNDMITRGLIPTCETYHVLIRALCDRETELARALSVLEMKMASRSRASLAPDGEDVRRFTRLRQEDNFDSAMTLFQALTALHTDRIAPGIYQALLEVCARRGNVDAALHVFAQLEARQDIKPAAAAYAHLLSTYVTAKDIKGADEIFAEFRAAAAEDRVSWIEEDADAASYPELADATRPGVARARQLEVWHRAIQAHVELDDAAGAVALIEEMLDSSASPFFGAAETPLPAPATYSALINAFCAREDFESAHTWFNKLLAQKEPAGPHYLGSKEPRRPDREAYLSICRAYERQWRIQDVNRTFAMMMDDLKLDNDRPLRVSDRAFLARANSICLPVLRDMPATEALEALAFVERVALGPQPEDAALVVGTRGVVANLVPVFLRYEARTEAAKFVMAWVVHETKMMAKHLAPNSRPEQDGFRSTIDQVVRQIIEARGELSAQDTIELASMQFKRVPYDPVTAGRILDVYEHADKASLTLTVRHWGTLLALSVDADGRMLKSILSDAIQAGLNPERMIVELVIAISVALVRANGTQGTLEYIKTLGTQAESVFAPHVSSAPEPVVSELGSPASSATAVESVRIDHTHSLAVDRHHPTHPSVKPNDAYELCMAGAKEGVYPALDVVGRLMHALGREQKAEHVRQVYAIGEAVIQASPARQQKAMKQELLNHMVIAIAHAGDGAAAHEYREALREAGGQLSSNGYGALVLVLKDTTDDAAAALALFQEARDAGVQPDIFLYNNVISKLSKARRVDAALELFEQMKQDRVGTTSVTYGTVIGACARVGDAHSAELLFAEMAARPNFRPRVPPYNTMIQLYVQTKPDRARALAYYNAMRQASVPPSEHTYKLLIDAYGTIEPIDLRAMEDVFQSLVADPRVRVTGVHWAALINAYGCAAKDLDRALAVFESIAKHPSTARARESQPDALAYEAVVGAIAANKRADLLPGFAAQIAASGVHMTAYVQNAFIRGFAAAGELDTARRMFEEMADPPSGVAAPNNHAPHVGEQPVKAVAVDGPVYREPSTWESMVRAELGAGERERAVALLERLKQRQYPDAVYNRISGILHSDDNVSPWPAQNAPAAS